MKNLFLELGFENRGFQIKYGKELNYISRLFSKFLSDLKIENLRKIYIGLVDFPNMARIIPATKLTKVCLIYRYCEWRTIEKNVLEIDRYRAILDLILETLLETAEQFDWPKESFKNAHLKVIQSHFRNEIALIAPKFSRDKSYCANVIVDCNKEFSSFIALIQHVQNDNLEKVEIIKITSLVDDFSRIIHKLKWINTEEFVITNRDQEINFKYSIKENALKLFLTPRIHDEKYLHDELKLLNPQTSMQEFLDINRKRIANLSFS